VQSVELTEGTTSPPGSLTESDLISKMEKHGIGTDASIPTHINNIEKRRYVTIESNPRRVLPTVLGQTLVNGYLAVDRDLVLPTTRQKLEQQLDLVARGEADHAAVVAHALSQFSKKFTHFVDNIHVLDELFELKFDQKSDSECDGVPFSKCGRCSRFLLLKKSSRGVPKLLCPTEDETYALPAGAVVTRFDGRTCPLCDFEVILCGFGGDISFPLCPRCFKSKPVPWPVNKQTGLSQKPPPFSCPHPVAHPIISQFVVCPCPECELAGELGAYLLTEPLPRGVKGKVRKTRKLHCARCELTLRLPKDVTECRPTRFKCASCFAFCVQVTYDTENTPLADGVTKHTACVSCDDLLQNESVLVKTPRRGTQQGSCGGRGRGRGDDGGGGGRGGHR
jgi:DNA topoisomerase-3